MALRIKILIAGLSLTALLLAFPVCPLFANPFEQVAPGDSLYEQVKSLGKQGLLDPRDQAVLDQERIVTRVQLALFAEKALANLGETGSDEPLVVAQAPDYSASRKTASRQQIIDLLTLLQGEASYLRTRLGVYDERLRLNEDELEKLKPVQDEVDKAWRKSNKLTSLPNFFSSVKWYFESFQLSGIASESVMREKQDVNIGFWTDLGGKGSFSSGLNGVSSSSNASAGAASIYISAPFVTFNLDGALGHWDVNFGVECYQGGTDMGTFTRGAAPGNRFDNVFDVRNYSDDKNTKNWDDYMSQLGFVQTSSLVNGTMQSTSYAVFNGMFMKGSKLPWVGDETKLTLILGRPGDDNNFEEGLMIERPFGTLVRTSVAAYFINDIYGVTPPSTHSKDLKNFAGNLGLNLNPVGINLEGGLSLYRQPSQGGDAPVTQGGGILPPGGDNPEPLQGGVGQVSVDFYPFTLFGFAISENYANFQSKVQMTSLNFSQISGNNPTNTINDSYGALGQVDRLQNNRYGWRANLGWNGRQSGWQKGLPSLFDMFILNVDVAQKYEYRAIQGPGTVSTLSGTANTYVIEPSHQLGFYFPEDQGFWGTFCGGFSNVSPVRQAFINNIENERNDGNTLNDAVRYGFNSLSERIPLMVPVYTPSGAIATDGSGRNIYQLIDGTKTYNYVAATLKPMFSKMLQLPIPVYGGFFFGDTWVSSVATENFPESVPNLFEQRVLDGALMCQPLKNFNVMVDAGWEGWQSAHTYPLIDRGKIVWGVGVAYDIPWGGGKMEWRYKHVDFTDAYLPANNYQGDQLYGTVRFLF